MIIIARRRPRRQKKVTAAILVLFVAAITWLARDPNSQPNQNQTNSQSSSALTSQQVSKSAPTTGGKTQTAANSTASQLANLDFDQQQIIAVNQNKPTFSAADLSLAKGSWDHYSDLDRLNRVGVADALIGKDSMPTTERERLYIQPTGWHNRKVQINGHTDHLYNRCHLIGYQLTGHNNNPKNLMTGTRSLNDPGMTYYENAIAQYIKRTGHHVRYQVRPVFRGNELVARGIQMMAQSVEDGQVSFNVYIFNIQTNYIIDYSTGQSRTAK